jgi:hypothetical protein
MGGGEGMTAYDLIATLRNAARDYATPQTAAIRSMVLAMWQLYCGDQMRPDRIPADLRDVLANLAMTPTASRFCVNICKRIVDTRVARLRVSGILPGDPDDSSGDQQAAADALWEIWRDSNMGQEEKTLYLTACVEGEAYMIPDWDEAAQRWSIKPRGRWDGYSGVEVADVDGDGEIRAAYYRWEDTQIVDAAQPGIWGRLTDAALSAAGRPRDRAPLEIKRRSWRYVYEQDRLRRFVRYNNGPERLAAGGDEGDGEIPMPCMPVIRFTHPSAGEQTMAIVGLQMLINDAALTLASAARIDALRLIWFKDLDPLKDGDLTTKPGTAVQVRTRKEGDFPGEIGQVAPSDLSQQREVLDQWIEKALYLGATPLTSLPSYYDRLPPSGRALQIANGECDRATQDLQDRWGHRWTQLFNLLEKLQGQEPSNCTASWERPQYEDPQQDLFRMQALQLAGATPLIMQDRLDLSPEEMEQCEQFATEQGERQRQQFAQLGVSLMSGADDEEAKRAA